MGQLISCLVNINHRVLKAAHHTPSMHREKFIKQLENLHKLSITLGQAMQGTQPLEAAMTRRQVGKPWQMNQQQARKLQGLRIGLEAWRSFFLSYRLWTVYFPIITKAIITVNMSRPPHRILRTVMLSVSFTRNVI